MDESDDDVYVSQLKELFAGCDTKGRGMIGAEELAELCTKLQLESQVDLLVEHLTGNDPSKLVDFDTFKEAFVMVLSSTVDMDGLDAGSTYADPESMGSYQNSGDFLEEVSPKYVKGERRYGRRSKPEFELSAELSSFSGSAADLNSDEPRSLAEDGGQVRSHYDASEQSTSRRSRSHREDRMEVDDALDHEDRRSHSHSQSNTASTKTAPPEQRNETFEAEGVVRAPNITFDEDPVEFTQTVPVIQITQAFQSQMNASISMYEQGPSESDQVRAIWAEVGVGNDGFLDINELAVVCEHIGMEDMDRDELQNLFKKLDQDQDGRVGFEEFLDGLFRTAGIRTPAPMTPIAPTPSLLTAQKAKWRMQAMSSAMDDPILRTATPSLLFNQPITRLFTALDPDNTGLVSLEAISEQLMEQGIHNPQEILEALEMDSDPSGRISLNDLAMALDQVLILAGENNGVYQAALTSYQEELKYLRSQNDQLTAERDKLKMDIAEANRQNTALVQEIDDRHATIEKTNETKLRDMEKKYQEKIGSLQNQVEKEREILSSQASNQTSKLLDEMDQLKSDEGMMKERVQNLSEENTRLEQELNEAAEKLLNYEKTVTKQQRDLDGFQELEERLADLETSRDGVSKQQEVFFEQNMRDMQEHTRTLQDRVDELTQENELLKHQASERKVRRKGKVDTGRPRRGGSVLSDYTGKPNVIKRLQNSDSENDSELDELDPRGKRQLPKVTPEVPAEDEELLEEQRQAFEEEKARLEAKLNSLKEQHLEELQEARENYEREIKDLEKKYRQEMKDMEETMGQESAKLAREMEEKEKESEEEKTQLVQQFEEEKAGMLEEFDQEKEALEQAFEIVRTESEETLKTVFAEELDNQLAEQQAKFDAERASLEGALSNDKYKLVAEIQQLKEDSDAKIRNVKMELEVQHLEDKEELETKYEEITEELRRQLRETQSELDGILDDGEPGLKGQLKEDFNDLLSKHKQITENDFQEQLEVERAALVQELEMEQQQMQEDLEKEKYELSDAVSGEKSELLEHFQKEREEMMEKYKKERNETEERFKAERTKMADKHRKEVDDLMKMNEETIEDLKKQHQKAIDKLEKEIKRLQEKLEKEKKKLEDRMQSDKERWEEENARLKERHLREMEQAKEESERERDMMEMAIKVEVERAVKKEVTDQYEEKMDQAKIFHEEEVADIIAEKELLENKLRMAQVAKDEAIVAVQIQTQEAALQQSKPDKASYDAITSERDLLKLTVTGLEEKLDLIEKRLDSANQECSSMETRLLALETEKSHLHRELDDLNKKYLNMQMQVSVADSQHSRELERIKQKQALEFQSELGHLREELAQREGRLRELERQVREKGEELKRAMSITKEAEVSEVRRIRKQKEDVERKYKKMRAMLDEYMKKLKEQLAKTTRHDVLLKELYVENSKLQRALQLTEERQKTAERNCHNLVEKNQAYLNILRKVCPAAV